MQTRKKLVKVKSVVIFLESGLSLKGQTSVKEINWSVLQKATCDAVFEVV